MSYQLQRFKLVDKSKRSETLDTCFEARTKANALNERLIRGTSLPLLYSMNTLDEKKTNRSKNIPPIGTKDTSIIKKTSLKPFNMSLSKKKKKTF